MGLLIQKICILINHESIFFSIYSKTTSKKNWQDQKSQILWGLFSIPNLSFYYNINKFYSFINRFEFNKILTAYSQFCLNIAFYCLRRYKTVVKEGLLYIRSIFIICFVDAVFTDDEPLWEPVEWSLVMSWILFIFIFAWAAENLITSRYGSYTGRDKRVWFGWFKTFLIIKLMVCCLLWNCCDVRNTTHFILSLYILYRLHFLDETDTIEYFFTNLWVCTLLCFY